MKTKSSFRRKRAGCSSQFRGVTWDRRGLKWLAQICYKGKKKFVGYFPDELSAARAFDIAARKVFSNPSETLNFPKL